MADADELLVAEALQRKQRGETPTRKQAAALERFKRAHEENQRWDYYRTIPQKHWRAMSGRQTKVLNEQAARYGLPFGGRTIDLTYLVRKLHDFLADKARKLAADDESEAMAGPATPSLEEFRRQAARRMRVQADLAEQAVVPRETVAELHGMLAAMLHATAKRMESEHGAEVADQLRETIAEFEVLTQRKIAEWAGRNGRT